jgi:hypothetical protein
VARKGGVLVLAAEGAITFRSRLAGLVQCDKLPAEPQPFAWKATVPSLLAPTAFTELEQMVAEIEKQMLAKWGVPLVMIAVDTLAAAANFRDESDAAEGQAVMNVLAKLAKRFGCCVLAVDHFGKVAETGTRGTSAKESAADAVLALLGDRKLSGEVSNCRLAVRKLRGGGHVGRKICFTVRVLQLGVDRDGDPISTCTIEWETGIGTGRPEKQKRRWRKSLKTLQKSLMAVLADQGQVLRPIGENGREVRMVDKERVRIEFYKINIVESDTDERRDAANRQAFNRSLNTATTEGLINVQEDWIWLVSPEDESSVMTSVETDGTGAEGA